MSEALTGGQAVAAAAREAGFPFSNEPQALSKELLQPSKVAPVCY